VGTGKGITYYIHRCAVPGSRVFTRKTLHAAAARHSGIEEQLDAWFRIARKADWKNLQEVRKTYAAADGVKVAQTLARCSISLVTSFG
jgi:mRNA-degrading endonuclease HigB of HigAB toxin-antitoxin module